MFYGRDYENKKNVVAYFKAYKDKPWSHENSFPVADYELRLYEEAKARTIMACNLKREFYDLCMKVHDTVPMVYTKKSDRARRSEKNDLKYNPKLCCDLLDKHVRGVDEYFGRLGASRRYTLEQEARKAKEKSEAEAREKKLQDQLGEIAKAVAFLVERGQKLDIDFEAQHAVSAANDLRFAELVKEVGEGPHSFSGDCYCEDCSGWDGESRRCECGNRRVSWSYEGNFENMYIYAEAF